MEHLPCSNCVGRTGNAIIAAIAPGRAAPSWLRFRLADLAHAHARPSTYVLSIAPKTVSLSPEHAPRRVSQAGQKTIVCGVPNRFACTQSRPPTFSESSPCNAPTRSALKLSVLCAFALFFLGPPAGGRYTNFLAGFETAVNSVRNREVVVNRAAYFGSMTPDPLICAKGPC